MRRKYLAASLIAVCLGLGDTWAGDAGSTPTLCGRIGVHDGLPVLEVWGKPEDAGFAHGYLMAEHIVKLFDEAVLDPQVGAPPGTYQSQLVPMVGSVFRWPEAYERELRGVLRGMEARLGEQAVRSERLDRRLTLDDLKVVNALADWRGVLCSSFSVWGALAAEGQTLTARNLDYPSSEGMREGQILLLHRGDGRQHAWAGVTWPGLIGVYTGMNDEGVTIALHDSNCPAPDAIRDLSARSLVLREALESAASGTFVQDVRGVLERHRVLVGSNIHVSAPVDESRPPAAVLEYDGEGRAGRVTVRLPDAEKSNLGNAICCTNHMRVRRAPVACERYTQLERRLSECAKEGERLDADAALEIIRDVQQKTTLHTVLFVPHRRQMVIYILCLGDHPARIDLDDWLNRPTAAGGQPRSGVEPADLRPGRRP